MQPKDPRAVEAFEAHVSYMSDLARAGGGRVLKGDGLIVFRSVVPTGFLVNGAARLDARLEPRVVLDAAREVFGDSAFELLCLSERDGDLRAAGIAAGMRPGAGDDPVQYLDRLADPGTADTTGIQIRQVVDARGVADATFVNQDASDIYDFIPPDFFARVFGRPETLLAEHLRVYVAYERGQPVATAEYARLGDLCYIGWVAVVQAAMRRGLGRWITAHAVNEGFADGARAAILVASPMGAPLYRRMGFVDVGSIASVYASASDETADETRSRAG